MDLASFPHAQQCLLITIATSHSGLGARKRIGLSYSTLQHKGLEDFSDVSKEQAMSAFEELKANGVVTHGAHNTITITNAAVKKLLDDILVEYQAEAAGQ